MTEIWALAALWLGLAFIAALFAVWFRVSTALTEIVIGIIAGLLLSIFVGPNVLGTDLVWVKFLAGLGAIVLTFSRGRGTRPDRLPQELKEATAVGLIAFFAPFFGCTAVAYWILQWSALQSWLAGVALSTTSVAVVYAVMLEYGFNKTDYGKVVLAACFINDLGTVLALGFIFAPFTIRTFIFAGIAIAVFAILPWLTPRLFKLYGDRPSELETKYLLFILFGLGALAAWAESEAVLPEPTSWGWCLLERSAKITR
jgi:glutathione-regulated potassium-efflux system ancillary protein KefC